MATKLTSTSHLSSAPAPIERRRKLRIYHPLPAMVEGVDSTGEAFKNDTVLDNLSAEGLYLRLMPCVERGTELRIVFRLSTVAGATAKAAPKVAVKGTVVRSEPKQGGACGVAVALRQRVFL